MRRPENARSSLPVVGLLVAVAEGRSGPPSRSASGSGSSELRGSTLSPCRLAGAGEEKTAVPCPRGVGRLSSEGRLVARLRVGSGALFHVRDCGHEVVAVCCYPVAGRSPPNLWFVDAPAPVRLPEQYPWPDHLLGSYGDYLLARRPRGRTLGLIDESGALAVELRCPRAITSLCVAEGVLVLAAGALICLEIDGLSPLRRARVWRPPFTRGGFHEPNRHGNAPSADPGRPGSRTRRARSEADYPRTGRTVSLKL
jgi:hypothetical protein